jgi:hypothetical protein
VLHLSNGSRPHPWQQARGCGPVSINHVYLGRIIEGPLRGRNAAKLVQHEAGVSWTVSGVSLARPMWGRTKVHNRGQHERKFGSTRQKQSLRIADAGVMLWCC